MPSRRLGLEYVASSDHWLPGKSGVRVTSLCHSSNTFWTGRRLSHLSTQIRIRDMPSLELYMPTTSRSYACCSSWVRLQHAKRGLLSKLPSDRKISKWSNCWSRGIIGICRRRNEGGWETGSRSTSRCSNWQSSVMQQISLNTLHGTRALFLTCRLWRVYANDPHN